MYKKLVIFTFITIFCLQTATNFAQSINIGTWGGNGSIPLTLNWPSTISNLPAGNAQVGANVQYAIQHGDLIHWVFPDGNFRNVIYSGPGSLTIHFRPTIGYTCISNRVSVTLVRKGGGVPPPLRVSNPITGTIPCPSTGGLAMSIGPSRLYFEAGSNLQLNNAWDWTPSTENYLILSYRNTSQLPPNLVLNYNPNLIEFSPVRSIASNKEIITNPVPGQLHISNLSANGDQQIYLRAQVLNLGAGERFTLSLTDQIAYQGTVYAFAHDPNQKNVDQSDLCPWQVNEQELTYNVRFLNIGTWYANDVMVADELCTLVEPSTVVMQGNSANMSIDFSGNNMNVYFPDLQLPGLEQTYPNCYSYDQASHAFSFGVNTISCLEPGSIKNQCLIFFDELDPVETNIATTMVTEQDICTPDCSSFGAEAGDRNSELVEREGIFPNPAGINGTSLTFYTEISGPVQVQILDRNGRLIRTVTPLQVREKGTHQLEIETSNLPSGVYLVQLKSPEKQRMWKLIVI